MNLSDVQIKNGWEKVKLKDIAQVVDSLHITPTYADFGYPMVRVTDIKFGYLKINNCLKVDESVYKEFSKKHIPTIGDLVFSRVGSLGITSYVGGNDKFCLGQNTAFIIPNIKNRFLYFWLTSSFGKSEIDKKTTGSSQKTISLESIKNLEICLPSDTEQENIAYVISRYDDLIENNEKRIKILESMAQKLYTEWFITNSTSKNWQKVSLGNIAIVHRGKSYSSEDVKDVEGIPFVNLKCVNRYGGFRYDGLKAFSGGYKDSHVVKNGDIVMAVTDMTQERMIVARVARIPSLRGSFGVISMDLVKIEPKENTNKSWLYCFLRYSGLDDKLKNSANGANVLHLNPSRISEYELSVPPFEVQESFANLVEKMLLLQERLLVENRNLQRARDLLIPQLVSGKILIKE